MIIQDLGLRTNWRHICSLCITVRLWFFQRLVSSGFRIIAGQRNEVGSLCDHDARC